MSWPKDPFRGLVLTVMIASCLALCVQPLQAEGPSRSACVEGIWVDVSNPDLKRVWIFQAQGKLMAITYHRHGQATVYGGEYQSSDNELSGHFEAPNGLMHFSATRCGQRLKGKATGAGTYWWGLDLQRLHSCSGFEPGQDQRSRTD
jgi:hypothetical protein